MQPAVSYPVVIYNDAKTATAEGTNGGKTVSSTSSTHRLYAVVRVYDGISSIMVQQAPVVS